MAGAVRNGGAWIGGCLLCGVVVAAGQIHGTVETRSGERFHGTLRWDQNENFWDDRLDAGRTEPPPAGPDAAERKEFRFSLFGLDLTPGGASRTYGELSVPFGHLRAIEPHGPREATLVLKSGARLEALSLGSDLGAGMRGVVVEDPRAGRVELRWQQIVRVSFDAPPPGTPSRDTERLYGTAVTPAGRFTGFLVWDRDESLAGDELDGSADGRDWELPFADIAAIAPAGPGAASVTLRDGRTLVLSGTNDVNEEMRGLEVRVEGLGTVTIRWDRLDRVEFTRPPASPVYERFDGGRPLRGTVRTRADAALAGTIVWDLDERMSFDVLDGERDGLDYEIPFEHIRSLRPDGPAGCEVRLADGRTVRLSGTNDVDASNRGLLVVDAAGRSTPIEYRAVTLVEFQSAAGSPPP